MAARSTSGFVCFSRITLVSSFSRYCIARFFHPFSRNAESRGTKETRTREGYDRRFLKYLTRYFTLVVSVRCSLKFFLQFDSKVVNSDGKSASNRPFNVIRVISRKNRGGMKIRIYFNETSNFFWLSLGYSLVSFRQHG